MPEETRCIACGKRIEGRRYRFSRSREERVCDSCRRRFAPLFADMVKALEETPDSILDPYQKIRSALGGEKNANTFAAYLLECAAETASKEAGEVRAEIDREVKDRSARILEEEKKALAEKKRRELEEKLARAAYLRKEERSEANLLFLAFLDLLSQRLAEAEEALSAGDPEKAKALLARVREGMKRICKSESDCTM